MDFIDGTLQKLTEANKISMLGGYRRQKDNRAEENANDDWTIGDLNS